MKEDLRSYLNSLPRGGVQQFAAKCMVSEVYIFQIAARQGGREPSPELCVRIEKCSNGRVGRPVLRPNDWHLIWPELITREQPAPAQQEA